MNSVVVIGAGLIGTSIALGCKKSGLDVELFDKDLRAQKLANDLVNSVEVKDPDLVVLATPIGAIKGLLPKLIERYPKAVFIDTGSVKTKVELDIQGFELENFCPTHPMAGRELDGAEAAQSDLFQGRTWVITPTSKSSKKSIELATQLIELLGAKKIEMSPTDHDASVALVSHLPQLISSLLAGQLSDAPVNKLELAGSGIIDTTRIAASNPELWEEILKNNRNAILPLLIDFQNDLSTLIADLEGNVKSVLTKGNSGRSKLPGKHGGAKRDYIFLPVVIDDKPGQLAKLFEECAAVEVSVEDLTIEHSPGQETGLITLALNANQAKALELHLKNAGWRVHPPRLEK